MKTILITGSTDGIGKLAAIQLATEGHQIVLHGRNNEKLQHTISEVKELSNNENISGFIADLSDFSSIQKMIDGVKGQLSKIDVLINNAGVFKSPVQRTQENIDLRFAVNYLAPYVLTRGLIPILENSDAPRVINLSSAAQSTVSLDALAGNSSLSEQEAYAQSKLALTMWSFYLAKMNQSLNVIALNPGSLLNTKMVQEAYGRYWSSADKGAAIIYDLAVSEKHNVNSGKYFDNDKGAFSNAHSDAYDQDKINLLIAETNKILNR